MISDISATIRTAYISQKTYDGFDGGTLGADNQIQDMGLLPPEYIFELEGEKMIGLSSPLTLINPVGYGDTDFSTLSIGVLVPQNLCVPLLTYDWRNADMKGICSALGTVLKNIGMNTLNRLSALRTFSAGLFILSAHQCGGKQTGKSSFAHSLFALNYKGMRKTPGINKISELLNNSFISCKVCFFHNLLTAS